MKKYKEFQSEEKQIHFWKREIERRERFLRIKIINKEISELKKELKKLTNPSLNK